MKTYLIGESQPKWDQVFLYLTNTGQAAFKEDIRGTVADNIPDNISLISFYAKLCYKSLTPDKNANITKTRSILENYKSVIKSGHGSVLEHVTFNFVSTDVSRVFTHELVRHRVGTAFSQTSGRYCSLGGDSEIVMDPILEPIQATMHRTFNEIKDNVKTMQDALGLNGAVAALKSSDGIYHTGEENHKYLESLGFIFKETESKDLNDAYVMPFATKKKLTSALRRIAPQGLSNEIGWSCNLRTLRHLIELRTSPHAEWEIRTIFQEVAELINPIYLHGGEKQEDGSWTNLRI